MKLELVVNNPLVVIPKHSTSKEILVVDLGKISVKMLDGKKSEETVNIMEVAIRKKCENFQL